MALRSDRPWGWYEVLHDGDYKVKRIHVMPGKRLSLQSHQHRAERWIVVAGAGPCRYRRSIDPTAGG